MKSFQMTRVNSFALAIVFSYVASATPISGKVTDAGTGEAIIGATIYDSHGHIGVVTDAEGNFSIDVASFPSELKISYVGYEQQSIRVKGDDDDSEKINIIPAPTLDGALGGIVTGVDVTQNGQPGAGSTIRIRGGNSVNASNNPLYVIDGFIYQVDASSQKTGIGNLESTLDPLSFINPSDIDRIQPHHPHHGRHQAP